MKEELEKGKKVVNNYLRYSGVGITIAATIGVGVFIGYHLDKWLNTPQPYFTLGFAIVFVVVGWYIGLNDFGTKHLRFLIKPHSNFTKPEGFFILKF